MKKGLRKIIVSLVAVVMLAYVGFTVFNNQSPVDAVTVNFTNESINSNYDINEKAKFPLSIKVDYNGEKTAENGVLVFPSGKTLPINDNAIEFTEVGEYTLRYFFKDGNVNVTAEKTFDVTNDLYGLTSYMGSSITPVTAEMNRSKDFRNLADDTMSTEKEGIIVRLAEGSEFVYNKPINLNDVGDDGLAEVIHFDPRMYNIVKNDDGTYSTVGAIASTIKVRITDCYDSSIFVEMLCVPTGNGPLYTRAGSNNQIDCGMSYPNDGTVNWDRTEYYYNGVRGLCYQGKYGQYKYGYSTLAFGSNDNPVFGIIMKYDNKTGRVFVNGGGENYLVNDLMNPVAYPSSLFKGFTTGEVYVSVKYDSYNSPNAARVDIIGVGKDKGDLLLKSYHQDANNPNYQRNIDDIKPNVIINFNTTTDISAAVGSYFNVPSAIAYDVNMSGEVGVKVYRDYYTNKKINVQYSNGAFKVESADIYYIEYSAVDKYGNIGTAILKVFGVANDSGKNIEVKDEKLTSLSAGVITTMPKFRIETVNDRDNVELKLIAECKGKETIEIANIKGLDNINNAGEDGSIKFLPQYSGEYTIRFLISDNVFNNFDEPYEYAVNCSASNSVEFVGSPFVERYLIKGATYGLNNFTAFEYSTGAPIAKKVDAEISFDGGAWKKINDTFNVEIEGNETAQVRYLINENKYVLSDVVKIVDVNFDKPRDLLMSRYFTFADGTFNVEDKDAQGNRKSDILYTATAESGDAKLEFVNSILHDSFQFEYRISSRVANFATLNIVLTDIYNPSNKTTLTIGKQGVSSYLSINGGERNTVNKPFSGDNYILITYNKSLNELSVGDLVVKTDLLANSTRCYLDVILKGIDGESGIIVRTLNNQKLYGNSVSDKSSPQVFADKATGQFNLGETITIKAPQISDILSPVDYHSIKFTIKHNGQFVKSTDGVIVDGVNSDSFRDYEVLLNNMGSYEVSYSARDISNNTITGKYVFVVADKVAPSIELGEFVPGGLYEIGLGEKLSLSYGISDNVTPNEECGVSIIVTNMVTYESTFVQRSEMDDFVLGQIDLYIVEPGLHRVNVFCMDASGNYNTIFFNVMVKA